MSKNDDIRIIEFGTGFLKTRNGELLKPSFDTKTTYIRSSKSGDSDKSTDKATSPINVNINVVIKTQ